LTPSKEFNEKLSRSSLGAPGVRHLARRTPPEVIARIIRERARPLAGSSTYSQVDRATDEGNQPSSLLGAEQEVGMSKDFTAEYLNEVLEEVAADAAFLSFVRGRRDEVLDAAEGVEGVVGRFVSGSIAHGTANGTTDADCGIELDPDSYEDLGPEGDPPGPVLEAVRSHIREVLRDEHPDIGFRITKRAIMVTFNEPTDDDLDPTVDLIVGLTREEGGLWIPNTERPGWDPSHPKKHTELLTGGTKSLRVLRARVIRLAKAWNNQFSQPGLSSFNLEALALDSVKADMSLSEGLAALFSYATTDLRKRLTPDPAGVSPAIKLLIDRDVVIKRLDKAAAAMAEALENASDEGKAQSALHGVFWDFIDEPSTTSKAAYAAEARRGNAGFAVAGGSVGLASASQGTRIQKTPRSYGDGRPGQP
jgi:hypothetical protein